MTVVLIVAVCLLGLFYVFASSCIASSLATIADELRRFNERMEGPR